MTYEEYIVKACAFAIQGKYDGFDRNSLSMEHKKFLVTKSEYKGTVVEKFMSELGKPSPNPSLIVEYRDDIVKRSTKALSENRPPKRYDIVDTVVAAGVGLAAGALLGGLFGGSSDSSDDDSFNGDGGDSGGGGSSDDW